MNEDVEGWRALSEGKTVGKRVVIPFNSLVDTNSSPLDIITIRGEDYDARQLSLTLCPMRVIPALDVTNQNAPGIQNASGEVENTAFSAVHPFAFGNGVAIIDWGVGGANADAQIDFGNGTVINITASFLRVRAMVENPVSATAAGYVLAAFVSPGYPRTNNAKRSTFNTTVAIGEETDRLPIPQFAKQVTLTGANVGGDLYNATINFWATQNPVITRPIASYFCSSNNPEPAPIPGGAMYYSITAGIGLAMNVAIFDLGI